MKKQIILMSAILMAGVSCTERIDTVENGQGELALREMTFVASPLTKTAMDANGNITWLENDAISVIDAASAAKDETTNHSFTVTSIAGDGTATFTGTASEADRYYAVYPYDAGGFVTAEGKLRIAFTSAQKARKDGIAPGYNPSAAVTENGVLNFKNLGGLMEIKLGRENEVKQVQIKANDNGTIGGVFYIYFDANGNIDESRTTLASSRTTITLTPESGSTFAAGKYYAAVSPRTYTGGLMITLTLSDGTTLTKSTTTDIVVRRSQITHLGTVDTAPQEDPVVTFPVVFPMGFPAGSDGNTLANQGINYAAAANTWIYNGWCQDEAYGSGKASTAFSGQHGKFLCKTQPQAYMTWNWDEKITTTGVKHFIETANTLSSSGNLLFVSTPGIKGVWTDDFFEFVLPVKDFAAGTKLNLSMPIYTRTGPTFWEVLYLDGDNWVSTAVDNLPAYSGADVTARATWAIPYLAVTATKSNLQSVDMTFSNAIAKGEVKIRVKCVDGSIISSAANTVKSVTAPNASSGTANAPFYFYNPGNRANFSDSITISVVE